VYDYNSISYEARERARSRERDAERERIVRSIRARVRKERRSIVAVLRRAHLAGEV
jgi:hypothetical protein